MEERLIVDVLFLPADENPPESIHPRVEPFDDPAAGAATVETLGGSFVAAGFDVRRVAASSRFAADHFGVVAFVATEMLRAAGSRTGAANRKTVERGAEEFMVMHVRAVDSQPQRYAAAIDEHRAFNAQLAPIRRVWPGFSPHPRVPWLSSRPCFATSIGCREGRRNAAGSISTTGGTCRGRSTLGSSDVKCCRSRTPAVRPSIGSQCGVRKRCHPRFFANRPGGDHPWEICGTWVKKTACVPTNHREYANLRIFVRRTYRNPP